MLLGLFFIAGVIAVAGYVLSLRGTSGGDAPYANITAPPPAVEALITPEAPAPPFRSERRSVFVHDFENRTGRADHDWLRIGIADMLVTDLAACDFLDVMSRGRVRDVGGSVPVDVEITGSYAEVSGKIQVMVQVHDRESGTVLAAVKAVGAEHEILDVIDRVSADICNGLQEVLARRLGRDVRLTATGGIASRLLVADAAKAASPAEVRRASGSTVEMEKESPATGRAEAPRRPGIAAVPRQTDTARDAVRIHVEVGMVENQRKLQAFTGLPDASRPPAAPEQSIRGAHEPGGAPDADKRDTLAHLPAPATAKAEKATGVAMPAAADRRGGITPSRPPLVDAVKARYSARMLLEADDAPETLDKALELLKTARKLAPGLRGIDEEIAALEAHLAE